MRLLAAGTGESQRRAHRGDDRDDAEPDDADGDQHLDQRLAALADRSPASARTPSLVPLIPPTRTLPRAVDFLSAPADGS